jgi:hypothetical protein
MKSLDDILFGFLIFFAIERLIRIFSLMVVGPWIETKTTEENRITSFKLFAEFVLLVFCIVLVHRYRRELARLSS